MTEKYEIIKNYVSRLLLLMFIYCLQRFENLFASGKYFLVCFKALSLSAGRRANGLGLFVFRHVHRVYLISVSLFCLFNVAFSGLVCVSASVVLHTTGGGDCLIFLASHCQLTWNSSTSTSGAEWRMVMAVLNAYASTHLHDENIDNTNKNLFLHVAIPLIYFIMKRTNEEFAR